MTKKEAIAHWTYEAAKILHLLSFQAKYKSSFPTKDDNKRLLKAKSLLAKVDLLLNSENENSSKSFPK